MSSIIGQCPECCECAAPTIERKTRSASKSKVGFPEFSGFISSPPKRYSTSTLGGIYTSDFYNTSNTCSGAITHTSSSQWSGAASIGYDGACSSSRLITTINQSSPPTYLNAACFTDFPIAFPTPIVSATFRQISIAPACFDSIATSSWSSDSRSETLSAEYTTSALISHTIASLPVYGSFAVASPSASRNLSTDELSYAVADSVYRFRFKVPKVGSGTTYIIKWVERFSPEGGGAVTDTVKTYTWSGTIPGGYDPTDSTTWPITGEYTLAVPATDGTTTLACITTTCSGTAPADPCNP